MGRKSPLANLKERNLERRPPTRKPKAKTPEFLDNLEEEMEAEPQQDVTVPEKNCVTS